MALPREVRTFGWVSLLTDASSEMIFPLLPAFLTGPLQAGPRFVGLVEGIAEATATLFKILSGRLSDRLRRRKPLVLGGYAVSSLARPMVAAAAAPWQVLALRFLDRAGKGVRGAPRDAVIADVTAPETRGRAFGLQRAMDHAGAVAGPLLASGLLAAGASLRAVFAAAAVPAALSLLVLAAWRERPRPQVLGPSQPPEPAPPPGRGLGPYLAAVALFTLGNSSDAFLLLRAQALGVPLAAIPLLWTFHHVVKSAASIHGGALADRIGPRRTIVAGWAVYAASYAGFAAAATAWQAWLLFAAYGLFHALTEGPERALVAALSPPARRGRGFGAFHALTGGMMLPASLLTGTLWEAYGAPPALLTGAGLAALAAALLWLAVPEPSAGRTPVAGPLPDPRPGGTSL